MLTPNTRPRVSFVDGVCNACINWKDKEKLIGRIDLIL